MKPSKPVFNSAFPLCTFDTKCTYVCKSSLRAGIVFLDGGLALFKEKKKNMLNMRRL